MQSFCLIFAVSFALIVPQIGFYVLKYKAFPIVQDTLIISTIDSFIGSESSFIVS